MPAPTAKQTFFAFYGGKLVQYNAGAEVPDEVARKVSADVINDKPAAVVTPTPGSFSGAYADLSGKPTIPGVSTFAQARRGVLRVPAGSNACPPTALQASGTHTGSEARTQHYNGTLTGPEVEVSYTNAYNNAGTETDGTDPVTVTCAVEYPAGTYHQAFTPGGSKTAVIAPGATAHFRAAVQIPANTVYRVRTYATIASSAARLPVYGPMITAGEYGALSATPADHTVSATGEPTTQGLAFAPSSIRVVGADPTQLAIAAVGDSIAAGTGDANTTRGFVGTALNNVAGYQRIAYPGDTAQRFATIATRRRRAGLILGCNAMLCEYGSNDVFTGRTLAQVQADLQTIWALGAAMGMKVWQTTITPKTTSTDAWATTANQTTVSGEAVRVSLNTWLRTIPAGLTGIVEVADTVESARNSGKWAVDAVLTADGLHPNSVGHTRAAVPLTAALTVMRAEVAAVAA